MRRILLARHGETEWNAIGRMQGHTDVPLSDVGRAQARALAAQLAGAEIAAIVTSDLVRARETGEIIAAALGLGAPAIEPALRERRFGVFEGLTRDECAARYPDAWRAWHERTGGPEGSEPRQLASARIAEALARIAAGEAGWQPGAGQGPVLVVTHGGLMRIWLTDVLGEDVPPIRNTALFALEHDGSRFLVRR
ncbi:MAG TPA: histidine phosphatase family protein [Kofleriaceae bacterium]|nr:histidine phosphatase family protein [Kofleriaceae bacterium]